MLKRTLHYINVFKPVEAMQTISPMAKQMTCFFAYGDKVRM